MQTGTAYIGGNSAPASQCAPPTLFVPQLLDRFIHIERLSKHVAIAFSFVYRLMLLGEHMPDARYGIAIRVCGIQRLKVPLRSQLTDPEADDLMSVVRLRSHGKPDLKLILSEYLV